MAPSTDAARIWSLAADALNDDDVKVIDDDELLDEDDLKKPDPATLRGTCGRVRYDIRAKKDSRKKLFCPTDGSNRTELQDRITTLCCEVELFNFSVCHCGVRNRIIWKEHLVVALQ